MSDSDNPEREAWLRGESPAGPVDDFARMAARGRAELGDEAAARELLSELDGMLSRRYGKQVSGADAGAKKMGNKAKVRRLNLWLAIAAAVLLLLAAGWWVGRQNFGPDAEALYAEAFTPYANDLGGRTMGDDDSLALDPGLAAALLAYDRGEYPAAVSAFEAYLPDPKTSTAPASAPQAETKARLYYGISLLAAGRAETAFLTLTELRNDATVGPAATWYAALALLRDGRAEAAREALGAIDTRSPFRPRAEGLLSEF